MRQRKSFASALTLVAFVALAGCGGDGAGGATGPSFPNVEGSYSGTWQAMATNVSTGEQASCTDPGTISITSQSGGSFSGSFVINGDGSCFAHVSGNVVQGSVRTDGGLDFGLDVPGAGADPFESFGCTVTSSDEKLNGSLSGNRIQATASANLSCPGGNVQITIAVDVSR